MHYEFNLVSFFSRAFRSFMYRLASRIGARAAEELAPLIIEHWPDILQATGRSASKIGDVRRLRTIFSGYGDSWRDILQSAQDTMTGHNAWWAGEKCRACESRQTVYIGSSDQRYPWLLCSIGHFYQQPLAA